MVYDPRTPGLLLFGGYETTAATRVAAPRARNADGSWRVLPDGPTPRMDPAAAHDPVIGRAYVWSGYDSEGKRTHERTGIP